MSSIVGSRAAAALACLLVLASAPALAAPSGTTGVADSGSAQVSTDTGNSTVGTASGPISVVVPLVTAVVLGAVVVYLRWRRGSD